MEYYEKRDHLPEDDEPTVIDVNKSDIRKLYRGANIFITGGAGFVGGLLIEKIARSCPDFGTIYLLLRAKRGVKPVERLEKLFDDEIFNILKEKNPQFMSRVVLMEGDLCDPFCGLSEENKNILTERVNFVFHIAACMRMAEPLKTAYAMNVRATKDLLDLGTKMKQLKGFVYVSTAYSNCFRPDISETFYETTFNWEDLKNLVEITNEEELAYLSPKVLGPWVNTYAFTKAVAEDLIKSYVGKIPIAIARPSIVVGCVEEPYRNWINNVYGATGVTAAACTGFMRVWYADAHKVADIIPVDYVVNTMISASWQIAKKFEQKVVLDNPIYNIVSSPKASTTWGEYMYLTSINAIRSKTACTKIVGEYGFMLMHKRWLFFLLFYLFHIPQGLLFDGLLLLKGKRPMLMKGYIKIMRFNLQLAFFCEREWRYEQHNVDKLHAEMSDVDRKLFPFDMSNFDWKEYHLFTVRAIFKYIIKSEVADPEPGRRHYLKFMRVRQYIQRTVMVFLSYYGLKYIGRTVIWAMS